VSNPVDHSITCSLLVCYFIFAFPRPKFNFGGSKQAFGSERDRASTKNSVICTLYNGTASQENYTEQPPSFIFQPGTRQIELMSDKYISVFAEFSPAPPASRKRY